jgi:hypothetical protein
MKTIVAAVAIVAFIAWIVSGIVKYENDFTQKCIAAGGTPSRYMTMIGKSGYQERLCIKPESIIEVTP